MARIIIELIEGVNSNLARRLIERLKEEYPESIKKVYRE